MTQSQKNNEIRGNKGKALGRGKKFPVQITEQAGLPAVIFHGDFACLSFSFHVESLGSMRTQQQKNNKPAITSHFSAPLQKGGVFRSLD